MTALLHSAWSVYVGIVVYGMAMLAGVATVLLIVCLLVGLANAFEK